MLWSPGFRETMKWKKPRRIRSEDDMLSSDAPPSEAMEAFMTSEAEAVEAFMTSEAELMSYLVGVADSTGTIWLLPVEQIPIVDGFPMR